MKSAAISNFFEEFNRFVTDGKKHDGQCQQKNSVYHEIRFSSLDARGVDLTDVIGFERRWKEIGNAAFSDFQKQGD